jgi:hypothetical protein
MLEIIRKAGAVTPAISDHLPGYYHHLFTFALAAANSADSTQLPEASQKWPDAYHDMAESVIDEVLKSAGDVPDSKPDFNGELPPGESSPAFAGQLVYPIKGLECLATCSFNQAMDFYSVENDQACLRWAQKAILLAESMRTPEGERLVFLFQKRLKGLF